MFAYTLHLIAHESRQMWCQRRNQQQVKGPHASSPQTWAVELDFSCVWHCSCLLSILPSLFSPETSYRLRRTDILLTAQLLDTVTVSLSPPPPFVTKCRDASFTSHPLLYSHVSTTSSDCCDSPEEEHGFLWRKIGWIWRETTCFVFIYLFLLLFSVASPVDNFTVFQQGYRPRCWNIFSRF